MEGTSSSDVPNEKANSAQSNEDEDFELTAEMMIHDFDDESTLNNEDFDDDENEDELADLEREGEMPLEELMAKYYSRNSGDADGEGEKEEEQADEKDDSDDAATSATENRRMLRSTAVLSQTTSDSESSDEGGGISSHESEWKKPRIGEEYQVTEIPDATFKSGTSSFHDDDKQVWVPWNISADVVEQFLRDIALTAKDETFAPDAEHVQDNEDALFILKQSENNPEEALKRFRSRPNALNNEIHVWSEEECQQFELGLTLYGKDFHTIHLNKVKTKSVRDIIKFYYMWKKSERYDRFTAKTRLGRRKETMHPDVTDYMDKLLDETDNTMVAFLSQSASSSYMNVVPHSYALLEHLQQMHAADVSDFETVAQNTITSQPLQINTNNNCKAEAETSTTASKNSVTCPATASSTSVTSGAATTSKAAPSKESSEHDIPHKRPKLWDESANFSKVYNNEMGLTN